MVKLWSFTDGVQLSTAIRDPALASVVQVDVLHRDCESIEKVVPSETLEIFLCQGWQ